AFLPPALGRLRLLSRSRGEGNPDGGTAMSEPGVEPMGRVKVEVDLANFEDQVLAQSGNLAPDKVRKVRAPGVVDSGASYLVVPKTVAKQLGVPATGKATVRYADRRKATRTVVENVRVELLGRHGTFRAIVE